MQTISTKFTRLLNLRSPIVSAPMYSAASPALAAAVTETGGFGTIAAGSDSSEKLNEAMTTLRNLFKLPSGVPIPVGVNFLGWFLDKTEDFEARIPSVLAELPTAVWISMGENLGKWVSHIRDLDNKRRQQGKFSEHKVLIFVMVNSAEEAVRAVEEWKIDVLVVQGNESGGHGSANALSIFMLLPAVLNALPPDSRPPVLAAGGITFGSQIASLLTLGADGVVVGTRFLLTYECSYTDMQKKVLLEAALGDTARGVLFDEIRQSAHLWPKGIDGRAIKNRLWTDWEEGNSMEERLKRYDEGKARGESSRLLVWAGIGVGMVDELSAADDVLRTLHYDTVAHLRATSKLIA